MNFSDGVTIREVQHFAYCPHRWGLIHIACDWSENAFVNKATLLHGRADSNTSTNLRGKYIEHSVWVYDDKIGLYGVLDCLQLTPDPNGCMIAKYQKTFRLTVVEYKPCRPKREEASFADRMQLLAQKVCTDNVFHTDCDVCLYYADIRKRIPIVFEASDFSSLQQIVTQISDFRARAVIPPVQKSQYCNGCSMKDICLPKVGKRYA